MKKCNGLHCRCMQKDCPNVHSADCAEHNPKVDETNNAEIVGKASECEGCAELERKVKDLKLRNSLLRNRTDLPIPMRREYEQVMTELAKVPELQNEVIRLKQQREIYFDGVRKEREGLENRIEVFQKAQSLIVGELMSRCDSALIEKVNKWVNGEDAEVRPGAVIINRKGEIRKIQFDCFICHRISVFTNEFVETKELHKLMQCPECLDTRFHVRSYDLAGDE
jgi:hypothetical protein